MDLPPNPPAIHAAAPECRIFSNEEAQVAGIRLQRSLPGTSFTAAEPSVICGLVKMTMASGKVVYTDATGRFLLLTFALDTHTGSPADNAETIEAELLARETFNPAAMPGVMPPSADEQP